jgi:OOP family OmpA-OmpF porin
MFNVLIVGLLVFGCLTMSALAAEIITVDDFEQKIVTLYDQKVVGLKTDNILFEHDKYYIQPVFYQELDEIGQFVAKHPESYVVLHGYTDDVGSQTYNLSLSQKSVESVHGYLTGDLSVDRCRVITLWYGEANPIASHSTETGRALNRRVEIAVGGLM